MPAGMGLPAQRINRMVHTVAIAPTLSLLVGAKPPTGAFGAPLIEVFGQNYFWLVVETSLDPLRTFSPLRSLIDMRVGLYLENDTYFQFCEGEIPW